MLPWGENIQEFCNVKSTWSILGFGRVGFGFGSGPETILVFLGSGLTRPENVPKPRPPDPIPIGLSGFASTPKNGILDEKC